MVLLLLFYRSHCCCWSTDDTIYTNAKKFVTLIMDLDVTSRLSTVTVIMAVILVMGISTVSFY